MRGVLAVLSLLSVLVIAFPAEAERRLFIIASNAGGYGVDRCLANGEPCGTSAAAAYCRSQRFTTAQSFRKVDRDDITGAIPTGSSAGSCQGGLCDQFVAIECTR